MRIVYAIAVVVVAAGCIFFGIRALPATLTPLSGKCFVFDPLPDITAYELALIFQNKMRTDDYFAKDAPEGVRRHLIETKCW